MSDGQAVCSWHTRAAPSVRDTTVQSAIYKRLISSCGVSCIRNVSTNQNANYKTNVNNDTPRTDAQACEAITGLGICVGVNFARELERESNVLSQQVKNCCSDWAEDAEDYFAALRTHKTFGCVQWKEKRPTE